jgi:hypothetical protein
MTGEQVRWVWKTWRWTRKTGRTGLWRRDRTTVRLTATWAPCSACACLDRQQGGIQSDHSGRRADPQADDQDPALTSIWQTKKLTRRPAADCQP